MLPLFKALQTKHLALLAVVATLASACSSQIVTTSQHESKLPKYVAKVENSQKIQDVKPLADTIHVAPAPKSQSISAYKKSEACPAKFYDVALPENGKLCQVFAANLPASLTLFVPQAPAEVLSYYTQDTKQFGSSEQIKKRYVLRSNDKSTTLIISKDGQGSQVDIRVTDLHKS